jgi:hypothetical protein
MKVTSFLSVCTLALATAVAAYHGQFEHKSVAPAHTGAPAHKPTHHWAARDAREHEHEHSAHTDDEKKASHHHMAREAGRHEYTLEAPASKPTHHHWQAREAREHEHHAAPQGGMKPTATHHYARDAARPTGRPSHADSKDEKKEDSKPAHHWIRSMFKSKKPEDSKPEHGRHHARDADRKEEHRHTEEFKSHHHARDAARDHKEDHPSKHTDSKPEGHPHHARDAAREHEEDHDSKYAEEGKSNHHARNTDHKEHEPKHGEEMKSHHHAHEADRKEEEHKHSEGKHTHHVRDATHEHKADGKKTEPMHTVAGKPGHHFVRSAWGPAHAGSGSGSRPAFGVNTAGNPYMGTRWSTKSAISSVRGILTGSSGIKHTCDRCVAAMQVGQSLASQGSTDDFSKAVVGLCKQVQYKSNNGCESAFSAGKVEPYVSALQGADLGSDGKGFCKQYFGTC